MFIVLSYALGVGGRKENCRQSSKFQWEIAKQAYEFGNKNEKKAKRDEPLNGRQFP